MRTYYLWRYSGVSTTRRPFCWADQLLATVRAVNLDTATRLFHDRDPRVKHIQGV